MIKKTKVLARSGADYGCTHTLDRNLHCMMKKTEQWQQWWLQCGCLVLCFTRLYPSPRINSWGPWSSAFLGKLPWALLIFCLLSFLSHIDSRWCFCWEELLLGTLASRQRNHAFPSNSDMPSEVCIAFVSIYVYCHLQAHPNKSCLEYLITNLESNIICFAVTTHWRF